VLALIRYGNDWDGWIPGYNTSGYALWRDPSERVIRNLSRNSAAPVQVNDWISPALATEDLPRNREHRFYTILESLSDPAMTHRVPVWLAGSGDAPSGDNGNLAMADWIEENAPLPARGVSYLMPAIFQLFGGVRQQGGMGAGAAGGRLIQESSTRLSETLRTHQLPLSYEPRLDRIGQLSRKVAFADGFRYIDARIEDFDASWSHQNWGSFSERSPCDVESRAWGRRGAGGTGRNIPFSYRHQGKMTLALWDGHVGQLSQTASRDPALWAPSRSKVRPTLLAEPDTALFGYDPRDPSRNEIP
jgi:prepilin-type processing-associated H-X9-DG protein